VVAFSTWGNLATCFYNNGTRHLAAMAALIAPTLTGGPVERKFDAATQKLLKDFQDGKDGKDLEDLIKWGTDRAPESYFEGPTNVDTDVLSNTGTRASSRSPGRRDLREADRVEAAQHVDRRPRRAGGCRTHRAPRPGRKNVPLNEALCGWTITSCTSRAA